MHVLAESSPHIMLTLPPDIDAGNAATVLQALQQQCLQGRAQQAAPSPAAARVEVDAGGLQRFDSSALAVLIGLRRTAAAQGAVFVVHRLSPHLQELAVLYGVQELLDATAAPA